MRYRKLGQTNEQLSAIGLGCMGMNWAYGAGDEKESLATLEKAIDLGINFWDTADMYAGGANEELVSKVLVPHRNRVFIATKFGFRFKDGNIGYSSSGGTYLDTSPAWIRTAVEQSLKRLRIETIDLYYAHRLDPNIPVEDTVGAMAELVKQGKVRYLGLSEASATSIRKAHKVHPIAAVQSEYSLLTRDVEGDILPTLRELGISLVPYSPLARGLVTNTVDLNALDESDFRRTVPRYQGDHRENNERLVKEFAGLAQSKNCTPAQLALAWVLAQGDGLIPIPGTKKRKYLEENAGATEVNLAAADLAAIDTLLKKYPNTGERYSEAGMKLVNH